MRKVSIIVAVAQNNVIGNNNQLIWHIPDDLKRFKALTMGHHIIMGRKTWESIGRPLPGRTSIVVTRNKNFDAPGAQRAGSLEEAIAFSSSDAEVFIIGGGELYRQALPMADRIYLTKVHRDFEGDVSFPELNPQDWVELFTEKGKPTAKDGLDYTFVDLERI
ncbi:MAG: dihydrofolate reductase [Tenuifilaceae bacterium]|jgi:dihydrofolate reductase|nr:dihydrofolate reductase [Tenuifilaceae bacterium]